MYTQPGAAGKQEPEPQWYLDTAKYEKTDIKKSISQICSSIIPYILIWTAIVWMVNRGAPWWLVLASGIPAAVFLVRIFIIFHDCTHRSYFNSRAANRFWGYVMGIFTLVPYERWQHSHNIHHNTYADLDKRGIGDVWTLTVNEYIASPPLAKLAYRFYRSPFVMFIIGPFYIFVFDHRFSLKGSGSKGSFSVIFNDLILLLFIGILAVLQVSPVFFLLYLYVVVVAGMLGVWLFYVQHQFEGVYWSRHEDWDPMKAAFEGSSYYKLPKILQWCTGNIGLHPVHHIRSRIPNYNLQKCYDETIALHNLKTLSIPRSLKSLWLNLWDEEEKQLVSFHSLNKRNN